MSTEPNRTAAAQRGMGIVEMMIGVVIGMIACVMIFQVLSVADSQKRSTIAGTDSSSGGAIAIYRLENDLLHAGFGLGRLGSNAGCAVSGSDAKFPALALSFTLLPVAITEGGTAAPDSLVAVIGSSPTLNDRVLFDASTDTSKTLLSRAGFVVGDVLIGINSAGTTCRVLQVSDRPSSAVEAINHEAGAATNRRFNGSTPPPIGPTGSVLNLGPSPRLAVWQVRGDKLMLSNRFSATEEEADPSKGLEVVAGVTDLQAQYGIDTGTGSLEWRDAPLAAGTDWSTVRAVRIALALRTSQLEKTEVSTSKPRWMTASRDLRASGDDWKHYRYRVHEASVPLRNVVWGK